MLFKLLNYISRNLRKKRFELFKSLFLKENNKLKILDVGGTQEFWEPYKSDLKNCHITILNLIKIPVRLPNFNSIIGDARNMKQFKDKEFYVVFSNSVIEHVGNWEDQKKMAKEIQRLGKHYFIQTPNYYFPIEPHFLFPFFQFLPLKLKIFLILHFNLGWHKKSIKYIEAIREIQSIRLLKKRELMILFDGCKFYEEKLFAMIKSLLVYK